MPLTSSDVSAVCRPIDYVQSAPCRAESVLAGGGVLQNSSDWVLRGSVHLILSCITTSSQGWLQQWRRSFFFRCVDVKRDLLGNQGVKFVQMLLACSLEICVIIGRARQHVRAAGAVYNNAME